MNEETKIAEEIQKMDFEPLLPVEERMIGWSIGLGVALLFILYGISRLMFPAGY